MAGNHAVFVAVLLGWNVTTSIVHAQSCAGDSDCSRGNWCEYEGGTGTTTGSSDAPVCDGVGCPEPRPDPEPLKGSCQPLPKGLCVDQGGCSAGLTCIIGTVDIGCTEPAPVQDAPGSDPGEKPAECGGSSEPAPYGYCTLPETKCTSDAQCLFGLKCVESDVGGGETVTDPACPPDSPNCSSEPAPKPTPQPQPADAQSTCQVAFDDCATSADCDAGYECVERKTGCSSSGSAGSGGGSVDPGQPGVAIDKQKDPDCDYESSCFPKLVACDNDAQCQANWICYAFEANSNVARDLWEVEVAGKGCLPKGLALAAEASFSGGRGVDTAAGSPESTSDNGDEKASQGGSGSSNCSVGLAASAPSDAWMLAMALGLVARRRRA